MSAELTALAMPDAKLVIDVDPTGELGPHGADDVEFLLAPASRSPAAPAGQGSLRR